MLLQVSSFEEDAAALDEGARHVREEVVPSIQGAEGLLAAYWAVGRENGKRVSIMVWDRRGGGMDRAPGSWRLLRRAPAQRSE